MEQLLKLKIDSLSDHQLSDLMVYLNEQYRCGTPKISDAAFDYVYMPELQKRLPSHNLITKVQPEPMLGSRLRMKHINPMLSTQKAYLASEVSAYLKRCQKASEAKQAGNLTYRITAKLDGLAAKYDAKMQTLVTRGDGQEGQSIGKLLKLGLKVIGSGSGVGEIVVVQSYFEENLSHMKHPRNFVSGVANSDSISPEGIKALEDGAIHLVLFKDMFSLSVNANEVETNMVDLAERAGKGCIYKCDGTIIEVIHDGVKQYMGATEHHHLWMLAFKQKSETANVNVLGIEWSVGRSKITPVLQLEPTMLSGAEISKVTAHHAGNVKSLSLGQGAVINLIRSGFVIPKIESIISKSDKCKIPTHCPSCSEPVIWSNDFILCVNDECEDRKVSNICYHFEKVEALLFGRKTVQKMVKNGLDSIVKIYQADKYDFVNCGIGVGQAVNLINERTRVKTSPVDDFKVIASLGISKLGNGASKRLLTTETINNITSLSREDIVAIDNFGDKTSQSISENLKLNSGIIEFLVSNLNIRHTKAKKTSSGSLSGLKLAFTGKMASNRNDMKSLAETSGADVQSSVRKDTTYLVTGLNVGATKINAAQAKGVKVITEDEFYKLIA
ncbi:BRCT domain-containing protein [Shewanella sp. UCD-KL12]|uniref:BRCT domain-containing protein n=1 Tax=Shewanella sp. UCD-KL12 TaxID=1917163 RepID=UPI0009706B7A|nr:BRCT domain-containing protein [Shewanella sp. UCD-KL12]